MDPDLAPDWDQADTVGCMCIRIEGDPNAVMECNIDNPHKPEELAYDGYRMTAMRIVNAIPMSAPQRRD